MSKLKFILLCFPLWGLFSCQESFDDRCAREAREYTMHRDGQSHLRPSDTDAELLLHGGGGIGQRQRHDRPDL